MSRRSMLKWTVGAGVSVVMGGVELRLMMPASATVPTPQQIGCDTWGARPPASPINVLNTRPVKVIVHHTAGSNTTDYSLDRAYALARGIQNHHMDTNGWIDSGQQFTISRGGYILEGRHRSIEALQGGTTHVQGAHCTGQNDVAIGIENEGTYTTTEPTQALYDKLVALIAYFCQQYAIPASEIYGHRDFVATTCPGDKLYAMLPQIRSEVAAMLGDTTTPPPPPSLTWPVVQRGHTGERVKTVQYLLRAHGNATPVDGSFTSKTEGAVKKFQSAQALTADGIVGAKTWEALIITVRNGSSGEAVKAVQSQLVSKGYSLNVDGAFGPLTENALRSFQSSQSLTADGVAGPATWNALVK